MKKFKENFQKMPKKEKIYFCIRNFFGVIILLTSIWSMFYTEQEYSLYISLGGLSLIIITDSIMSLKKGKNKWLNYFCIVFFLFIFFEMFLLFLKSI